jgi:hypothetical protein
MDNVHQAVFVCHRLDGIDLNVDTDERPRSRFKRNNSSNQMTELPTFLRVRDGAMITIWGVLDALKRCRALVPDEPVSRWPNGISVTLDCSKYRYEIKLPDGSRVYLKSVGLKGDFTAGLAVVAPLQSLKYSSEESVLSVVSTFTVYGEGGRPVNISVHMNADKSLVHATFRSGDEFKEMYVDRNNWWRIIDHISSLPTGSADASS